MYNAWVCVYDTEEGIDFLQVSRDDKVSSLEEAREYFLSYLNDSYTITYIFGSESSIDLLDW